MLLRTQIGVRSIWKTERMNKMAKKRTEVRVPGPLCVCDAEGELTVGPDGEPMLHTLHEENCPAMAAGNVADSIVADITIYPKENDE
jgi:hypothetical protein